MSSKSTDDITSKYMSDINSNMSSKKKKRHHGNNRTQPESLVNSGAFLLGTSRSQAIDTQNEEITATYHISKIQKYLQERLESGLPPVSEEEINEHFQSLGDKEFKISSIPGLKKRLLSNIRIRYIEKLYSYQAELEIQDANQLLNVLKEVKSIKSSQLQGAYKGYEKDLNKYMEEGYVEQFPSDEDRKTKLYFYFEPEYKAKQAQQIFRDLWKNAQLPGTTKGVEQQLIELGGKPMELVEPIQEDDGTTTETQTRRRSRKSNTNSKNQELLDSIDHDAIGSLK